jgi:hypothetical protein
MPAMDRWISKGELNHVMILYIATRGDSSQRDWIAAFVQSLLRGGTISALNSVLAKWVSNIKPNHALALVCFNVGVNPLVWMRNSEKLQLTLQSSFSLQGGLMENMYNFRPHGVQSPGKPCSGSWTLSVERSLNLEA